MKRWILSVTAAATLGFATIPTTAEACGGYGSVQLDPTTVAIQAAINDHFQKVRASVRVQRVANVRFDVNSAQVTVFFVDGRERVLSQDIRLAVRGTHWAVVGGARPVQVSNV